MTQSGKEFELVETRRISGTGVLQFPEQPVYRFFLVYVSVLRSPSIDYKNFEWMPDRGFYCRVAYMRDKYVLATRELFFENEVLQIRQNEEADWLINPLICTFGQVLQSLAIILTILGVPAGPPAPVIEFRPVELRPDRLQFACRDDTAIEIELWGIKNLKQCVNAGDETAPPPPKEPPGRPPVPPGTPIEDISPPPPGDPFPEDTNPNEIDEQEEPGDFPIGGNCQLVEVTFRVFETPRGSESIDYPVRVVVWGEVLGWRLQDGSPSEAGSDYALFIQCRGRADDGGQCGDLREYRISDPASNFIEAGSFFIEDITFTPL